MITTQYDRTFLLLGVCFFILLFSIYFLVTKKRSIIDYFINIVLFIMWFVGSILISNFISYN